MKRKTSLILSTLISISIIFGAVGFGGCSDKTVTVNFVTYCQDEIPPTEYEIDNYYRKLPTPTRDGYEFLGWFSDEVGGELIKNNNKASRNTKTLYARWVANDNRISVSYDASFIIDDYGNLWAWGCNEYGQLGDGTTEDRLTPIQIITGTKFSQISNSNDHSLALDIDGNLWTWGRNTYGQLGDGTTEHRYAPMKIMQGTKFIKIVSGGHNNLAIDIDGNLWSWGQNYHGVIGDGTFDPVMGGFGNEENNDRYTPIQIIKGTKFKDISAGNEHCVALDVDGNIWTWGASTNGELGNGIIHTSKFEFSPTPQKILQGIHFKSIGGRSSVYAFDTEDNLWVWGYNGDGELGLGKGSEEKIATPVQALENYNFKLISTGTNFAVGIDNEGYLYSWGNNYYAQLGNGTYLNTYTPVNITDQNMFVCVSSAYYHSIAIDYKGNIWGWGYNRFGQLGNGTIQTEYDIPIQINLG